MNKIIGNDYIFNTRKIRLVAIEGERAVYWIYDAGRYDWLNIANIAKLHVIDKPQTKNPEPVYTQAMADAGELPKVGMECLIQLSENTLPEKCKVIGLFNKEAWVLLYDGMCTHIFKIKDYSFKPLTPPIELTNGKAYQFDTSSRKNLIAIYFEETERFMRGAGYFNLKDCTNIKLLEVK